MNKTINAILITIAIIMSCYVIAWAQRDFKVKGYDDFEALEYEYNMTCNNDEECQPYGHCGQDEYGIYVCIPH